MFTEHVKLMEILWVMLTTNYKMYGVELKKGKSQKL